MLRAFCVVGLTLLTGPLADSLAGPLAGAVVGVSVPAESLTATRVERLPQPQRTVWMAYLQRSEQQLARDHAALAAERARLPGAVPAMPKESSSARSIPVDRDAAFYATPEALRLAETILSFQIPNGGWSKNLDMAQPARLPGQGYTPNNISHYMGADDFDAPRDPAWNYVGTLDNDATNTELKYLLRMSTAYPGAAGDRFRAGYLRGVDYLLAAQYPNGGWPQVWPLEGGYHDAITFNDDAVTESAATLENAGKGVGETAFVPAATRVKARAAAQRALACILRAQVVVNGKLTVWAQQHDPLTLAPVAGRNFEPAALSAGESSDVLIFLMQQPQPSAAVRAAIEGGVAWLRAHAVYGQSFTGGRGTPAGPGNPQGGRHLEAAVGAGPIWPRYTSLVTGKPVFGDRDKTVHDDVMELSVERRNGYAWYSAGPAEALAAFAAWGDGLGSHASR